MNSETAEFIAKAREFLEKAAYSIDGGWADEAGRGAYLAGLHAAQALVFERSGHVVKRHRGVQSALYRLTKDEPGFDPELRVFLGRAYNLKEIADYMTGPGAQVPDERAQDAIATARRLIEAVEGLLQ
ncbi:MAG TPA: HEPN domain-containing protein [Stellaceae bacterium]